MDPRSAQLYLENAECDVLFLYDCCHSIHAGGGDATASVKEALAAGGFETIAAEVGEHSFTHLMTNELARAAEQGHAVSVSDLHGCMLTTLRDYTPKLVTDGRGELFLDSNKRPRFEPPRRRTPVHYFLSQQRQSIVLAPLRSTPPSKPMHHSKQGIQPMASQLIGDAADDGDEHNLIKIDAPQFPQVIVSVRLQSSDSSEAKAWVKWLLNAPPDAEKIKVEGWFGSFSTLFLLKLPLQVWHTMSDNPAVSFVGFVTTENMASALPLPPNKPTTNRSLEGKNTRGPGYSLSFIKANRFETPLAYQNWTTITSGDQQRGEPEDIHLSCPFRKRNQVRFNVRDYQSCAVQSFPDISQLK